MQRGINYITYIDENGSNVNKFFMIGSDGDCREITSIFNSATAIENSIAALKQALEVGMSDIDINFVDEEFIKRIILEPMNSWNALMKEYLVENELNSISHDGAAFKTMLQDIIHGRKSEDDNVEGPHAEMYFEYWKQAKHLRIVEWFENLAEEVKTNVVVEPQEVGGKFATRLRDVGVNGGPYADLGGFIGSRMVVDLVTTFRQMGGAEKVNATAFNAIMEKPIRDKYRTNVRCVMAVVYNTQKTAPIMQRTGTCFIKDEIFYRNFLDVILPLYDEYQESIQSQSLSFCGN